MINLSGRDYSHSPYSISPRSYLMGLQMMGYADYCVSRDIKPDFNNWERLFIKCVVETGMTIYFIQCESSKKIKIGRTKVLKKRTATLKSQNSTPLTLLASVKGHPSVETGLHRMLSDEHSHGEWFNESDGVKEAMAAASKSQIRMAAFSLNHAQAAYEAKIDGAIILQDEDIQKKIKKWQERVDFPDAFRKN